MVGRVVGTEVCSVWRVARRVECRECRKDEYEREGGKDQKVDWGIASLYRHSNFSASSVAGLLHDMLSHPRCCNAMAYPRFSRVALVALIEDAGIGDHE